VEEGFLVELQNQVVVEVMIIVNSKVVLGELQILEVVGEVLMG